jgi:hypothetical protein
MIKMKKMRSKYFIEHYLIPNEDDETYRDYYEGNLAYDEEFLIEVAKRKGIKLTDIKDD